MSSRFPIGVGQTTSFTGVSFDRARRDLGEHVPREQARADHPGLGTHAGGLDAHHVLARRERTVQHDLAAGRAAAPPRRSHRRHHDHLRVEDVHEVDEAHAEARPIVSIAPRATGSPAVASSVINGPVSSRPSSSAWPSAVSGWRATAALLQALDAASGEVPAKANAAAWDRFLQAVQEQSASLALHRVA